jgi:hypothetical protein
MSTYEDDDRYYISCIETPSSTFYTDFVISFDAHKKVGLPTTKCLGSPSEQDVLGSFETKRASDKIVDLAYIPKHTKMYNHLLIFDNGVRELSLMHLRGLWTQLIRDGWRPCDNPVDIEDSIIGLA